MRRSAPALCDRPLGHDSSSCLFAGALGFASALSLSYVLDETAQRFATAADGDPTTAVEQPR